MQILLSMMIFAFISLTALAQGTMSTDDSVTSEAEASLSGYTEDELDLREEEVQMQEEHYDPTIDDRPIEIEMDQELMDEYNQEVE